MTSHQNSCEWVRDVRISGRCGLPGNTCNIWNLQKKLEILCFTGFRIVPHDPWGPRSPLDHFFHSNSLEIHLFLQIKITSNGNAHKIHHYSARSVSDQPPTLLADIKNKSRDTKPHEILISNVIQRHTKITWLKVTYTYGGLLFTFCFTRYVN